MSSIFVRLQSLLMIEKPSRRGSSRKATFYESTIAFSSFPTLKKGTTLEGTFTFSPVFGFLPVLGSRFFTLKLPKPLISIFSPSISALVILSKMRSTMSFVSLPLIWDDLFETFFTKSILFIIFHSFLYDLERLFKQQPDRIHHRILGNK